jgi:hypothetical protein
MRWPRDVSDQGAGADHTAHVGWKKNRRSNGAQAKFSLDWFSGGIVRLL